MSTKKVAVVLSGSGVFDGPEIHEATFTLYAIMKNGGKYEIFAPDVDQHHVINHITGEEMNEKRSILIESARIARGAIKPLSDFEAGNFDAIIFPGGFGAAKNLSSFAFDGADFAINKEVEVAILGMVQTGKPIGALCISPVIIAKVLGGVELTIGQDEETAKAIEEMGSVHKNTNHGEVIVDEAYKVATTPCYMLDASIMDIADGANNVVADVFKMME